MTTITKEDIEGQFPEVFESYTLQSAIKESRYDEKLVRERDGNVVISIAFSSLI